MIPDPYPGGQKLWSRSESGSTTLEKNQSKMGISTSQLQKGLRESIQLITTSNFSKFFSFSRTNFEPVLLHAIKRRLTW
jgi:hypothetical protein